MRVRGVVDVDNLRHIFDTFTSTVWNWLLNNETTANKDFKNVLNLLIAPVQIFSIVMQKTDLYLFMLINLCTIGIIKYKK